MTNPTQPSQQVPSVFLQNVHHAYAQTDGTFNFPNSREGDMLKRAKTEIEELRAVLTAATPGQEAVRNAALEEAALECEKVDTDYYQHPTDKFACWTNRGSGCAGAIRHLKSASVSEQKGDV